jgi:hypothetical protein
MMRRFLIRLSITVLLNFALLVAVSIAAGRLWGAEQDSRVAMLHVCDGVPCIMGVMPGVTRWQDVETRLESGRGGDLDARIISLRLQPNALLELYPSVNQTEVGRIYLLLLDQPVSAGWIIQRFGVPCGVSLYHAAGQATLRYPALLANVQMYDARLRLNSPVTSIRFADPHFVFQAQPDPCVDNITSRQMMNSAWMGFTTVRFYEEHQR